MENHNEIVLMQENMRDAELTQRALNKYSLAEKLTHIRSGTEAIDFFFAKGVFADRNMLDMPRLVILDLDINGDDGALVVLKKIKTHESLKMIPVVMLSSSANDPDILTSYYLGANSCIIKPPAHSDFIAAISELGLYWMLLNKAVDITPA